MKVAVIGAGVMGCAAAEALARRGASVILFDRETIGAPTGSSMGPSRIIRLTYGEMDYVVLAQRAFGLWRELEAQIGESLLIETGGIDVAEADDRSLSRIIEAMRELGVPFEYWTHEQLSEAYRQFRFGQNMRAVFQPNTSVLRADRCVAALAAAARQAGVLIRDQTAVETVDPSPAGVKVQTAAGTELFDRVVICAGSYLDTLLDALDLQLPLTISMEQSVYFATGDNPAFEPGQFPICIAYLDEGRLTSIFPSLDEQGVKMMIERKSADDARLNFAIDEAAVARVERRARQLMPTLTGPITRVDRAPYTLLPDEDFLVDRHPQHSNVILCSACSGHGFKFAPVIGEMLADLSDGAEAHPRFRFDPDRFGGKARAA